MTFRVDAVNTLLLTTVVGLLGCPAMEVDPTLYARQHSIVENFEAAVPPMCYTKTGSTSNPCWVCHTAGIGRNTSNDFELQRTYAFSEFAQTNRWRNLFNDRTAEMSQQADAEIDAYVQQDNYTALRRQMRMASDYAGYRPDLDLRQGFDTLGFARDGSGWRAIRYQPFPGMFWPSNGSMDDVFVRLPTAFQTDEKNAKSQNVYAANFDILEAAMRGDATPAFYVGAASSIDVTSMSYPLGVEFLHSVRYLDPAQPTQIPPRMKELRYMSKVIDDDESSVLAAYEEEVSEKEAGRLPRYGGSAILGMYNSFGWKFTGFIEDANGLLRLQTNEEHRHCMGCHSMIGVTVDQTFSFPRKVPGAEGWRHQTLVGQQDRPQVGHSIGEASLYFSRVQAGDELRANDELRDRFATHGTLARAAVCGDQDLAWLLTPSPQRARQLNKAYRAIVRSQQFTFGRDALLRLSANVHAFIGDDEASQSAARTVYTDGRLHLDWSQTCE